MPCSRWENGSSSFFNRTPQAIVATDAKGYVIRVNRGFESLFGYPAAGVVGSHNLDIIVPDELGLEMATLRQTILSGKTIEKETRRKHKSGKLIPVSLLGFPIFINNLLEGVYYVYQDITQRKALEDQLYRKAFYDGMTGLPNRVLFMDRLKQALSRLRQLGIRIAIDDFGTGYFSLAYLKHFPLDFLKMDKSFVDGINADHENLEIARAIITLARNLNLAVVAEGIEQDAQLETLRGLNCSFIQGYYYSRPVPAEKIEAMLGKDPQLRADRCLR